MNGEEGLCPKSSAGDVRSLVGTHSPRYDARPQIRL